MDETCDMSEAKAGGNAGFGAKKGADSGAQASTAASAAFLGNAPRFDDEAVALAREALQQVRTSLMLTYRFLDVALWKMPLQPALLSQAVATDGATLWFDPVATLRRFQADSKELARDVLHALLHCILRHPFDGTHDSDRAWWLACDMAVEEMAREMAGYAFPTQGDRQRSKALDEVFGGTGAVTPQRLYEAIADRIERIGGVDCAPDVEGANVQDAEGLRRLQKAERLFVRDSHELWPQGASGSGPAKGRDGTPQESAEGALAQAGDTTDPSGSAPDADDPAGAADEDAVPTSGQGGLMGSESSHASDAANDDADDDPEQSWEDVAKRIQEDLETYSKAAGNSAACLVQNLEVTNRKPVDYADFLRRFATRREDMKVNDEEFDYIFYTYGMDTYGDMPLIEPLEYQETSRVRDFVIAIDTSASCAGDLVRRFIDRTFQMLQQTEYWGSTVNMHIVQCDDQVRDDVKITSVEDLAKLGREFRAKGMGATDFRPVFAYVDELVDAGEFDDLRGIIYFTDGYGIFPKAPPAYDTAFVFVEDEGLSRDVPPWAMKVILRNEQLKVL